MPKQAGALSRKTARVTESRATLEFGTDDKSSFVPIQEFYSPTVKVSVRRRGKPPHIQR